MDERDAVLNVDDDDEDAEGEDLYGDTLEKYASSCLYATRSSSTVQRLCSQ
jgi:hypothetical protein